MSDYFAGARMVGDAMLQARMAFGAADTSPAPLSPDPLLWVAERKYELTTSDSSWQEKWAAALAANNPDPGSDPTVITDAMIRAEVQKLLA